MTDWKPKMHDVADAIAAITAAGITVRVQAYGFSVSHPELNERSRNFIECGCEHDSSISMSVFVDELPPVVWFFRFDFLEMALLITESYRRSIPNASRSDIISQMRCVDSEYNHDELDRRIDKWQQEFHLRFPSNTRSLK